jgi:Domain of unknown function (DUF1707)
MDRVERKAEELRIGDAERNAAADELAEHYALGRLSSEEHHERLDRVWAARTRSDLAPVFSDLPGSAYQAYQRPAAYATADLPAAGQERLRRARVTRQGPFPVPPFGRSTFGRPPFAGTARRGGRLPVVVRLALLVVVALLVVSHLPLLLLALVIWLVLAHHLRRWGGAYRIRR